MTVALISTSPRAIIAIYGDVPNPMPLPTGDRVEGASVGWQSEDAAYALVAVSSFVTPTGQQNTGGPSYAFDANGDVVETYATQPIPALSIADQAQAALDASDTTAIRCFKAGIPFPPEWQAYVAALRAIVTSNTGSLPARPSYPAGT